MEDGTVISVIPNTSLFDKGDILKEWISYEDVCVDGKLTLFNNYFDVDNWDDYDIDYQYYINEVDKLISPFKERKPIKDLNKRPKAKKKSKQIDKNQQTMF
jgi:hypothetical protein